MVLFPFPIFDPAPFPRVGQRERFATLVALARWR